MSTGPVSGRDAPVLEGLRRRGQFLISGLLWAAVGGLLVVLTGYALILYHFEMALAERIRASVGLRVPTHGPDWFMAGALLIWPILATLIVVVLWRWYRRIWLRRLRKIWPSAADRKKYSRWHPLPVRAAEHHRQHRSEYLSALMQVESWAAYYPSKVAAGNYESRAEWVLADLEKDIAERALTAGLTVGISRNRYIDLFTIFVAALELQLHVLSRLGKRPSWPAWRLLIQRCGASLFINTYLNRQDALALNLMIKKAGMGLQAVGDMMEGVSTHLSESDIDLDEAFNLQHAGLLGMATKSLELSATMALTVGQVGLHALGNLIESAGDELAQGALAAGIIYYHGIALASDTLALDELHRQSPAMNRGVREGVWKMGEIAGSILRDVVRQRRNAYREKRRHTVRSLPRTAYAGIQALFGRKIDAATEPRA